MKARLEVGAEVDFLTSAELERELAGFKKDLRKMMGARPRVRTMEASGQVDATSLVALIDFPPAPTGMAYDVRRINVTGQDPTVAPAGQATVWRGDPSNPFSFVDGPSSMPNVGTWSSFQLTFRQDERFLIRVTGGGAGVILYASAQVIVLPMGDVFEAKAEV